MSKFKFTILLIIFFLLGALIDRAVLYYEQGERNKKLLQEQESLKEDYQMLINKFESVENELKFRMLMDSLMVDSIDKEISVNESE